MIDPEALAQLLADLAFPSGNQLGLTLDDMDSQLPTHCRVIARHLCDDAEARGRLVATLGVPEVIEAVLLDQQSGRDEDFSDDVDSYIEGVNSDLADFAHAILVALEQAAK